MSMKKITLLVAMILAISTSAQIGSKPSESERNVHTRLKVELLVANGKTVAWASMGQCDSAKKYALIAQKYTDSLYSFKTNMLKRYGTQTFINSGFDY